MNFTSLADETAVKRTIEAVSSRGIKVELTENKQEALTKLQTLIPVGATVMTGASVTLKEIGFEELLKNGNHQWRNFKGEILAEKDPVKQSRMRKEGTLSDYFVGSVHAIAETGEIVVASATGSQFPSYSLSSSNVIWVAGIQKITPTLDSALQRIREFSLPMEDKHVKELGNSRGSFIGKILIFEREASFLRRKVTLILVKELLGF